MTTKTLPRLAYWCEDCDGPCAMTYCDMVGESTCEACHEWLECPCQDEDY